MAQDPLRELIFMAPTSFKERLAVLLPTRFRAYVAARTDGHRRFVGPPGEYDLSGASQFNLLTLLGLREHHDLLDVGCGGLRAGRLFISYLQPGRYFGIEPEPWLVLAAIRKEIGRDQVALKRPVFDHNREFKLSVFGRKFDFILASSVFSHAAQGQIRTCLLEARKTLRPNGCFVASFVPGSANYSGDGWVYPGAVTYTLERLSGLADEQGLVCEALDWAYVYGTDRQTWLVFTLAGGPGEAGAGIGP